MKPIRAPLLNAGDGLYLKAENLQPGGSYKTRGVARLFDGPAPPDGFSTVSAGNLGRSLAIASAAAGVPCTVYVPDGAPAAKKDKIVSLGADLVELPFEQIWDLLLDPPAQEGFVHPTRNQALAAGYAEIARELVEDLPKLSAVVIPFGLGGLCLAVAVELRRLRPGVKVFAAELDEQAPLKDALDGKHRNGAKAHGRNFVDAIGTPELLPGQHERARELLAGSITVTLGETRSSLALLHRHHNLKVEGAAAVAHAAAVRLRATLARPVIAAVLTGGNIAPEVFERECRDQLRFARATDSRMASTSARSSSSV